MDTSNFDNQAREHLEIYKGFMSFSKMAIGATIAVLVLMAIFLL